MAREDPMSRTWLTGKMYLDHVRHRPGPWHRELVKNGKVSPEKEGGDSHH